MMTMLPAMLEMIARDQAARAVDPATLSDHEKNAKILALQSRVQELEHIGGFLIGLVEDIGRETLAAGADDRGYRRRVLALVAELDRCRIPVASLATGADVDVRRAL